MYNSYEQYSIYVCEREKGKKKRKKNEEKKKGRKTTRRRCFVGASNMYNNVGSTYFLHPSLCLFFDLENWSNNNKFVMFFFFC